MFCDAGCYKRGNIVSENKGSRMRINKLTSEEVWGKLFLHIHVPSTALLEA